ncbi:putative metal-dependent phosphoesterase TrpH [Pseudoduganella flava]|uniref:Phosphoesterase n=1 Tax=Pseudoduganella flava TaxID=871742 RepID=A0A562PZK7_9BURK|nr:CehA/McbA family metallohydrolase [Pseudoduganella flava]QGZ38577.1 phosphoesterase [Pseudoduganella flava]TWI49859.1 putative metal-dependent phosphoesterase TrpH [Pseudoduganella flava]
MRRFLAALLLIPALAPALAEAAVRVLTGPTPIEGGDAQGARDITVVNGRLAFALAVDSPVPYGVPRGALVDVAAVQQGRIGRDRVVYADFIPNNWSAWPNTYQRVRVLERGPRRAVVETVRDWGGVTVRTRYTLEDGSDRIAIDTAMTNGGAALPDLLSGYTLWPKGGFLFGVPGAPEQGAIPPGAPRRTVAYDADYAVALHAPYADHVEYGSKDLYVRHTLAAGATRRFHGYLQVGARGDLAPVITADVRRARGKVTGAVQDGAVIVAERDGVPYGWTLADRGRYTLPLPPGDYTLYASAQGHADSARVPVRVRGRAKHDFAPLAGPGSVQLDIADERGPLAARIAVVAGQQPLVGWLGRKTFFTALDSQGRAALQLAPGHYVLRVSHGFTHAPQDVELDVATGTQRTASVRLARFADPAAQGWHAADLHHHADQAEASTPPAALAAAQLAAGLDVLFVSDHDTMVNLPVLADIGRRRGVPVLGSMEFSASWGHFNAYPLGPGGRLQIDLGTASVQQIFAEARRLGATVVQVNHPYIPYGFFASAQAGTAPGGYDAGFDVAEINAGVPDDDAKVLAKLWQDWNAGVPHYLAGGTDTHDVWNGEPGGVRTYAHFDGPVTAAAYAAALKAGHAYVSAGPLIAPDVMFGTRLPPGPARLGFALRALAGIRKVELVADGVVVETRQPAGSPREVGVVFEPEPAKWYALVVEDGAGKRACTNPVWAGVP